MWIYEGALAAGRFEKVEGDLEAWCFGGPVLPPASAARPQRGRVLGVFRVFGGGYLSCGRHLFER